MVAEEYLNKPVVQESNDYILQDLDQEAEETLSLCDLVEGSNWNNNDFSRSNEEYQYQSASSDDAQDFFEFFSEDFTASLASANHPKDNIIFCGKLIPYKEEAAVRPEQTQKTQKNKRNRIFPWKSNSMKMSRSTSSKAQQHAIRSRSCKALSQENGYQKYDFPVKQVSTRVTSVKPRWYLLAFGYGRFPSEMKLRDIKNRQSRRTPATMFQSDDAGGDADRRSGKRSPWKGIRTLLKILGCKSQQANAVVRASFDRIRHV